MSPRRVQAVPTDLSPDVHERDSRSVELERACVEAVDLLFTTGYKVSDAEYYELRKSVEEVRAQLEIASRDWNQRRKSMVTH
jgi:hypothetical protein